MYRTGHYGVALGLYAPVVLVLATTGLVGVAIVGEVIVLGTTMLPDIDKRLPAVKRRGSTHTIWFGVIIGGIIATLGMLIGGADKPVTGILLGGYGFLIGFLAVVAHIAADMLTSPGVTPFMPGSTQRYTVTAIDGENQLVNYLAFVIGLTIVGIRVGVGVGLRTVV